MPSRRKYIYDPVHGSISLVGASLELVSHPLVQRLWGIRQTGMAHLVFPGAGHSRLEHSLGVLWVARAMAHNLGLSPEETLPVELAGFLHDLGHTPFSHTLEGALWECQRQTHEDVTQRLILGDVPEAFGRYGRGIRDFHPRSIPDVLARHGVDAKEVARLLRSHRPHNRPYLAEMLHGSIDADRLDYLQRDAHYTGVAHGAIDANRLLETMGRDRGHVVFAEKGRAAVEGFLVARSLMYASVYYNKTVRIAEVMLQSALERLPGYPERGAPLLALTDAELLGKLESEGGRAAEITRRLQVRQLFKRAATLPQEEVPAARKGLLRLLRAPAQRRYAEDALAEQLGGEPGDALLDLAGIEPTHPPDPTGPLPDGVRIREGTRVQDLLRSHPVWATLLSRPPTPWAVAVYTLPKLREEAERRGLRLLERYL